MSTAPNATSSLAVYGELEARYLELIRQFPLRPLRTNADLDAAVAVMDSLIDQDELSLPEQDYLDVLSDLVHTHESEAVQIQPVGDADMLRFLIEQKGITQVEAAEKAGIAESTISAVLAGKRKLNRLQIGKLARFFHIEPGVFMFAN